MESKKSLKSGRPSPIVFWSLTHRLASAWRASKAREWVVKDMQQRGALRSLPGTVQGQEGWYQICVTKDDAGNGSGSSEEHLACHYRIDGDNEWKLTRKPVPLEVYKSEIAPRLEQQKEKQRQPQGQKEQDHEQQGQQDAHSAALHLVLSRTRIGILKSS